ncbi:MAG: hypothetical protein JSS39_10775 [Nitrospira sp.]|nr:hypothetical protein [Nitrospira sp.]
MDKKSILIIMVFAMVHVSIGAAQAADMNVSKEEFLETIMKISGDKKVKIEEGTARLIDSEGEWSILGANQKKNVSYERSATWSLPPNQTHELLIVDDPISDTYILPFSDPVPNVRSGNDLSLVAARGEVESGSFVLRSGSNPLRGVTVEVNDLVSTSGQELIEATSIDVSVVKCWFQAGGTIDRTVEGTKRLVPELLLHNPELVQVDYEHQVNLVKNLPSIEDSERLVAFDQPKQFNQQFWITLHVPKQTLPGFYTSTVRLSFDVSSRRETQQFALQLQVLPFELPEPIIDYAMFYKGQLNSFAATQVSTYNKSPGQMLADFRDMREHGLTNVAIEDDISPTGPTADSMKKVKETVALMREAGFNNTRMLYIDWELRASDNRSLYTQKLRDLLTIAKQKGFSELFVYNRDEQQAEALLKGRLSFETAHEEGVKNFVATSGKSILKMAGLLDVIILRRKDWRNTDLARQVGMESWAYADPQGGEERPFTYRSIYGVRLWAEGFDGVCEYTYQSATRKERTGWNDWGHDRWRPHTMSYATRTRPIRTLQWEGWREGIDDVRYLTMLLKVDPLPGRNGAESRNAHLRAAIGIEKNAHPSIMRRKIAERIVLSIKR